MDDPALPKVLGNIQGRLPPLGQDQANLVTQIDGLSSKTFASAIEALRGLGAMTEAEGRAATESLANLSRIQDEKAWAAEATRLKTMLSDKLEVARQKAAQVGDSAAAPAAPPAWMLEDPKDWTDEQFAEFDRFFAK